jgi:hypothetical protein
MEDSVKISLVVLFFVLVVLGSGLYVFPKSMTTTTTTTTTTTMATVQSSRQNKPPKTKTTTTMAMMPSTVRPVITPGAPAAPGSRPDVFYAWWWYAGFGGESAAVVLPRIPAHCSYVMIGFTYWEFSFMGPQDINKLGIENLADLGDLRATCANLKSRNIKPLLSMGGWTYSTEGNFRNWKWTRSTAESVARVVRHYGFSGVDLDQERDDGNFVDDCTAIINDLRELLPPGSTIALTVMGYKASDGRANRIVQNTKGRLDILCLMTYGLREDTPEAGKRAMFRAITDPDIAVGQGYSWDGFNEQIYRSLGRDVQARGPGKGGVFMWGRLNEFINKIRPL